MKTLVVYASKHGATKVGAERIAKGLEGEVQLVSIKDKSDIVLDNYEKVILGTPIYAGMINKDIKSFCEAHMDILKTKKVALYFCCMDSSQIENYLKNNFTEEFIKNLTAVESCGGAFYFKKINFFEKFIIKKITESKEKTKENPAKVDTKVDIELFDEERISKFTTALNQA